jgi:CTP:molybdopterin cytidylyltransferase MocA
VRRLTTGLVLAAGGSNRLGAPRRPLDLHGHTLPDNVRSTMGCSSSIVDERLLETT